jgi:histidinol dehydrogenase
VAVRRYALVTAALSALPVGRPGDEAVRARIAATLDTLPAHDGARVLVEVVRAALTDADGSAPADWVAMDLFSQAEHDESAQAILLSPDGKYLDQVQSAVAKLLPEMPRRKVIAASLKNRGALILTRDLEEACAVANRIAPEHLELAVQDPEKLVSRLKSVGAIFLGQWSSEALGDYCAGPNHVLPTAGTARFSSPLGVYDFQKRNSVIEFSRAGALAHSSRLQASAR